MSVRRQFLIWGAVTGIALLLAGVLAWRGKNRDELLNSFLVGDPNTGAQVFERKGCSECHSVLGSGGHSAPDLGLLGSAGSSMNKLVTEMWNHAPRMWEQIKITNQFFPQFSSEEMADLFAYLYVTCYDDESGDVGHGQRLFTEKGCIRCHSLGDQDDGVGSSRGPDLSDMGAVDTPIFWAQTMWNHAPAMETRMREIDMAWPRFDGEEMNDLLAYVRHRSGGPEHERELLPADSSRGWTLFQRKGCITCHAVRGTGGTAAPDLGLNRPLPRTLTQAAGWMWNHSPEMWAAMKTKGIERPKFDGQEMADLLAFLYSVRYFDLGGSATIGEQLFSDRKCARCHGADARGGRIGPSLRKKDKLWNTVSLARSLWSHGPHMYAKAEALGFAWPTLNEADLPHLLAFLNSRETGERK